MGVLYYRKSATSDGTAGNNVGTFVICTTSLLMPQATCVDRHLRKQLHTQSLVQSRKFVIFTTLYVARLHRKQASNGSGAYPEGRSPQKVPWIT